MDTRRGRNSKGPVICQPSATLWGCFYLSLLCAVGDKRDKFGDPDNEQKDIDTAGPLTEILA